MNDKKPSRHAPLPGQQGLVGNRTAAYGGPPTDAAQPFMPSFSRLQKALEAIREVEHCKDGKPATIYCDCCFDNMAHAFFTALALAHPEDAPGGPWELVKGTMRWHVQCITENQNTEHAATFYADEQGLAKAEAVRDALNRLATEGETDG